jgi:hypothetical protein
LGLWALIVIGRILLRGFDLRMWQFFLTDLQSWIYILLAFIEQYLVLLAITWLAPARSKPLAGAPSEGGSLPS